MNQRQSRRASDPKDSPESMNCTPYCIMLSDADVATPRILGVTKNGATIAIPIDLPAAGWSNGNGGFFRYSEGCWIYNLSTKALSSGTYKISIELPE
jgi:hypothetical protein